MRPELLSLAQHLHGLPHWEHLCVFGSAVSQPDTAVDLDVGLLPPKGQMNTPTMQATIASLLQAARRWYGDFDPFALTPKGTLYARSDDAQRWQPAKQATALRAALEQGEPFQAWYDRVVLPRLSVGAVAEADPTMAHAPAPRPTL